MLQSSPITFGAQSRLSSSKSTTRICTSITGKPQLPSFLTPQRGVSTFAPASVNPYVSTTSQPNTRRISLINSAGTGADPQDRNSMDVTSFARKASRSASIRLYIDGVPDMKVGLRRSIAPITGTASKPGSIAAAPPSYSIGIRLPHSALAW